jgi:hypothetical protein
MKVRYTSISVADTPPTSTDSPMILCIPAAEDRARSAPPGIAEFLYVKVNHRYSKVRKTPTAS